MASKRTAEDGKRLDRNQQTPPQKIKMLKCELYKVDMGGLKCSHPNCQHNPQYHFNVIGKQFHLKKNTTALMIYTQGISEIYCQDCIDLLYKYMKPFLDKKLWAFK